MKCPDCKDEMVEMEEGIWHCYCGLGVEERMNEEGKVEYYTFRTL